MYRRIIALSLSVFFYAVAAHADTTLPNPTGLQNIQDLVAAFLKAIVRLSLPVIAIFFVYAGFKFILARGNEKELGDARKNLGYSLGGAALILGAWVLAELLGNTVKQLVQ